MRMTKVGTATDAEDKMKDPPDWTGDKGGGEDGERMLSLDLDTIPDGLGVIG